MKNNILITGVNGFIGSSLLKELLIQNHSVVEFVISHAIGLNNLLTIKISFIKRRNLY